MWPLANDICDYLKDICLNGGDVTFTLESLIVIDKIAKLLVERKLNTRKELPVN